MNYQNMTLFQKFSVSINNYKDSTYLTQRMFFVLSAKKKPDSNHDRIKLKAFKKSLLAYAWYVRHEEKKLAKRILDFVKRDCVIGFQDYEGIYIRYSLLTDDHKSQINELTDFLTGAGILDFEPGNVDVDIGFNYDNKKLGLAGTENFYYERKMNYMPATSPEEFIEVIKKIKEMK